MNEDGFSKHEFCQGRVLLWMSEFALVILVISTRDVDGSLQRIFLLFCYLRIITL